MLDDKFLSRLYDDRRGEVHDRATDISEFGPEDLVGKRIIGVRDIETSGDNPRKIRSYDFDDGSSVLIGLEGFGKDYATHVFLIGPDGKDRYTEGYGLISPR